MKTIIFGAGNCGRLIAQQVLSQNHELLGFVDNDPAKKGGVVSLAAEAENENGGGGMPFFRPMICFL